MIWLKDISCVDTLYGCGMGGVGIKANTSHIFECSIRSSGWEDDFNDGHILQFLVMDAKN